jgi:hypothetical protein
MPVILRRHPNPVNFGAWLRRLDALQVQAPLRPVGVLPFQQAFSRAGARAGGQFDKRGRTGRGGRSGRAGRPLFDPFLERVIAQSERPGYPEIPNLPANSTASAHSGSGMGEPLLRPSRHRANRRRAAAISAGPLIVSFAFIGCPPKATASTANDTRPPKNFHARLPKGHLWWCSSLWIGPSTVSVRVRQGTRMGGWRCGEGGQEMGERATAGLGSGSTAGRLEPTASCRDGRMSETKGCRPETR